MHNLNDAQARLQAVLPHDSFIVQAPAGSGKTELLTQRFLNLLTTVDSPEQVVALTFTRKAASEMKERILSTLRACAEPNTAERKPRPETLERAQAVLDRDSALNWQLLNHPHRLRVMTIDALCQSILRCMPLQTEFVAQAQMDMYPERLYLEAALACLAGALADPQVQPQLIALLRHLDNQQDKLIQLWVTLLQARDQWLNVIMQARDSTRAHMETALHHIQEQVLKRLIDSLQPTQQTTLHTFCVRLASLSSMPAWGWCLREWHEFDSINLDQAKALAKVLLTSLQTVRKRADHHVGLKREATSAACFTDLKTESETLFEQLGFNARFIEALVHVSYLPQPEYDERQWEILQALFTLLLHLVAHLKIVFREKNRVDFIEVSACALSALGEEDAPTDLGLYLDYAIKHLLIDEFQDTSITQFNLISRLIAGWEPNDGRTLFIVGDPMQSIYRFRQAEVGLFLKVQQEGIGLLQLTPLSLSANFRSAPLLVEWVNQHVAQVFPKEEEIELGAISFHASQAIRHELTQGVVSALHTDGPAQEAEILIELIKEQLHAHPEENLAILVRSRRQLEYIVAALQSEQIPFEGVDLFPLADMAYLRDVCSLTQALLMPAARLPWLCVLRGPYVGLSLSDLHVVAMVSEKQSIYASLDKALHSAHLSKEGRQRLTYAKQCFQTAFELQNQFALSEWVLKVHLELLGQAMIDQEAWFDLERYFELLDQFSEQHTVMDWAMFDAYFRRMYATHATLTKLKIMTIHQSKGLEFDTVFLPGLGAMTQKSNPTLLRWISVIQHHGEKQWLLSPLKAQEEASDPLYDYLGRLDGEKERYERQRLLYVGVTRAKKRLFLLDNRVKPHTGSFRAMLATYPFESLVQVQEEGEQPSAYIPPTLSRLTLEAYTDTQKNRFTSGHERPVLSLETSARRIGIIAHRWLQRICQAQIKRSTDLPWQTIEAECQQAGLVGDDKEAALALLSLQFNQLFECPQGQWLIDAHTEAQSEYAFCVTQDKRVSTYIVDRIFYADGTRWIIDFKTGHDDEATQAKHKEQVTRYAYFLKSYFNEPIACGVYYLSTGRWVEIEA